MIRLIVLLILISVTNLSWSMSNLPSSAVSENAAGKPASDFTLETTSGASQSFTQARADKKTILFFWATWCPHCHEELEKIRQRLNDIKQQGIQIVLVNVGENKEAAKNFLKSQDISLDSFVDEDNTVAAKYDVTVIPTVVFIDEKGIVRGVDNEFPLDYQTKFNSK